jgi:hypothetical protein
MSSTSASPVLSGCGSCQNKQLGVITSSHLSSFGVAYLNTDAVKVKDYPGIGTEREAPLDHPAPTESHGIFYLAILFCIFALGNLLIVIISKVTSK